MKVFWSFRVIPSSPPKAGEYLFKGNGGWILWKRQILGSLISEVPSTKQELLHLCIRFPAALLHSSNNTLRLPEHVSHDVTPNTHDVTPARNVKAVCYSSSSFIILQLSLVTDQHRQ